MDDKLLLLSEARELIPGRPSKNTVWAWVRHGLKIPSGDFIRLRAVRIGGRYFVTKSDLESFLQAVANNHA